MSTGKHHNNNSTSANNNGGGGGGVNPMPMIKPKTERRRTVSMRKMHDAREELLRRSTTPDVKEVKKTSEIPFQKVRVTILLTFSLFLFFTPDNTTI